MTEMSLTDKTCRPHAGGRMTDKLSTDRKSYPGVLR